MFYSVDLFRSFNATPCRAYASEASRGYDFDELKAILEEGRRQALSIRSKPSFKGNVASIAPTTIKDFTQYEHALAPDGKDFIFKENFAKYNIHNPLLISYKDFKAKCEEFITLLDNDKTYICHLVALHDKPQIGFRSLMKSFFISSKCDLDKFVGLIYRGLNLQIEKYHTNNVLTLSINFKESLLKDRKGPIKDIIEIGRDVVKDYDYDWNKAFKDPSLFPIQTMVKIESLIRSSFETNSPERLREIHQHLEKLATILKNNFTDSFSVDNYLESAKHLTGFEEFEPIIKRLNSELRDTKEAMNLIGNRYNKKLTNLTKVNRELIDKNDILMNKIDIMSKEISNLRDTVKLFILPRKESDRIRSVVPQEPITVRPLVRTIVNIWDEINNGTYLLNTTRTYRKDYEILLENGIEWKFLDAHIDALLEEEVNLNELHIKLIKNIIDHYGAFKHYMESKLGIRERNLFKTNANRFMKKYIGKPAREYSTMVARTPQWSYDTEAQTASMKWNDKILTYFYDLKEWMVFDYDGNLIVSFRDNLEYRTINSKYILYFESLNLYKQFKHLPTFQINKIKEEPEEAEFAVWDTEEYHTYKEDGSDELGLLCAAYKLPNKKAKSFYLDEFASAKDLSINFWLNFVSDARGRVAYAHNAKFDYAFMLEGLIDAFGKDNIEIIRLKSVIKEIRIYELDVDNKRKVVLKLHCSQAKTDASLRSLCETYKVKDPKGYFPYKFPTKDKINYRGEIPPYSWWSGNLNPLNDTPLDEYNALLSQYKNKDWDLKESILKHMVLDLKATEQVITAHAKLFYDKFKINIHKHCTLASMGKYLTCMEGNYNKETALITRMPGNEEYENFIRNSYKGGINDTIKTYLENGRSFDCNSMYPKGMIDIMPIGQPVMYVPKEKDLYSDKYVHFVRAVVEVPEMINPPLLHKNPETGVMHLPVGIFEDYFYTPELLNAVKKFGVKILEIKMGVRFLQGKYTFKKNILNIYKTKEEQDKLKAAGSPNYSPPIRNGTKLLLNSSYGGFGMKDNVSITKVVTANEAERLSELFPIELYKELSNGLILIGYKAVPNLDLLTKVYEGELDVTREEEHILETGIYGRTRVNVAISAAVTANARINLVNIGKSIIDKGGEVYKCATDSWYLRGEFDKALQSNNVLGKWKCEHIIDKGVFPASNIYMLNPESDKPYIKCGGLKSKYHFKVSWQDLLDMLSGKSLDLTDNRWSRPIIGSPENAVTIKPIELHLLPEVKKRIPIYLNGSLIGGSPIKLHYGKPVQYDHITLFKNSFKELKNSDLVLN